ncbi:unnamed protein product [Bursaphelenchus okinawaensis]|uniref:Tetratricopeptide repeat protein 38 n=1 Tax=Bursaphelenchus okinawaensis TaxID=465554 RepID=A0A811K355_9BILA|nr:unnamed protein product [Bursaphelenchus okinawaensis]CAG9090698.1 unnamed protein product [Bursaphelenchus okinawaensis]
MGSWCAENLRDVQAWKDEGLPTTTVNNESAKLYDAVLRQLVSWIDCEQVGGLMKSMEDLQKAEPESVLARCLLYGIEALGSNTSVIKNNEFKQNIDNLVNDAHKYGNSREQQHSEAVKCFAYGDMSKACSIWEDILKQYPNDLMAIKFAHDGYFFQGDAKGKLTSVSRVIDKWDSSKPCYGYLYGIQAFGYEENLDYENGKKSGFKGLEYNKQDAWSTHAIAHCHEMLGEYEDGIKFMESTVNNWEPCWMIACHNFWHNALFYIEKGDYESALTIYDEQIGRRSKSGAMLDLVDAASLLQRLKMEKFDVGKERWAFLIDLLEPHHDNHTLAFNDAHIAMVYSNCDDSKTKELLDSINNFDSPSQQGRIVGNVGRIICEAVDSYNADRFNECFDKLFPIRHDIYTIGGSNAQRDVFNQIIVRSGLMSTSAQHNELVKTAIEERRTLKVHSPLMDRIVRQFLK